MSASPSFSGRSSVPHSGQCVGITNDLGHALNYDYDTAGRVYLVKTPRTVVYDILREILREARQFNPREFRVLAAPAVIDLMLDEESPHLAGLSDFIAKPISLQAEGSMGPEQFDVVLL